MADVKHRDVSRFSRRVKSKWIPAFAGMTEGSWIPAYAGMTKTKRNTIPTQPSP